MTEFNRDFFKNDRVFRKLYEIIKARHVVADHTAKTLYDNRNIKDFCETSRVFVYMEGKPAMFIHYDVASWYHKQGARIRIESIGVYDDFMEYEKARMFQLHKSQSKDIPNIN